MLRTKDMAKRCLLLNGSSGVTADVWIYVGTYRQKDLESIFIFVAAFPATQTGCLVIVMTNGFLLRVSRPLVVQIFA